MQYNTQRTQLVIPEYGRNVQKMVEYACSLNDKEERNKAARGIIKVMGQINPHLRDVEDYAHKLWTHLFIISDFKLDVDSPYPFPEREKLDEKPEKLKYPGNDIRYRHYGRSIQDLIKKASGLPDGDEKKAFTESIANLMKKSYLSWNRDSVNDQVIVDHLDKLSEGKLQLDPSFKMEATPDILARNKPRKKRPQQRHNSKNYHRNKRRG